MARSHPADPGRRSTPTMIRRFVGAEMRSMGRKAMLSVGLRKLHHVSREAWLTPDSALARDAFELVSQLSTDLLLHHTQRTYAFGALLAERNGFKLDRELFYLAATLHDLGLTDTHRTTAGSFEWVGADAAYEFCVARGLNPAKADLVYDAIALHTSVGIADRREPEVAMVHFGAGLDLMGLRIREIPRLSIEEVLHAHPRTDFKCCFSKLLDDQVQLKPTSHISGAMKMGLTDLIKEDLI